MNHEATEAIAKMEAAKNAFYLAAIAAGPHGFIEFTGLLSEYINMCITTADEGSDFNRANTHSNKPLVITDANIDYIVEKLECVYGPTLRSNPDFARAWCMIARV